MLQVLECLPAKAQQGVHNDMSSGRKNRRIQCMTMQKIFRGSFVTIFGAHMLQSAKNSMKLA